VDFFARLRAVKAVSVDEIAGGDDDGRFLVGDGFHQKGSEAGGGYAFGIAPRNELRVGAGELGNVGVADMEKGDRRRVRWSLRQSAMDMEGNAESSAKDPTVVVQVKLLPGSRTGGLLARPSPCEQWYYLGISEP
jgi:hypothetical protein